MSIQVVTGAFGYTGKYIAKKLISQGVEVRTLTNSPDRENPFGGKIEVHAYNFDNPKELERSLSGASVLYNTYWVRFNHSDFSYAEAVSNTKKLFLAAKQAGVEKIVHVSITNPSLDSDLEYFSGKAELEQFLINLGVDYAILRPAVFFGHENILINNIAWTLRRFPIFGIFGDGSYRLQPIHIEDFASLAISLAEVEGSQVINAVGQESYSFRELVSLISKVIAKPRPIVSLPPLLAYLVSKLIGQLFVNDTFVTKDEITGLMRNLLCVGDAEPVGEIKLSSWLCENATSLGVSYASELNRRFDRLSSYGAVSK